MTHLVHDIRTHGPLMNYDNLKYERRHSLFINKIRTIKNRCNLSKTLVEWDCRLAAIQVRSRESMVLKGSKIPLTSTELQKIGMVKNDSVYKVKAVCINDEEIRQGEIRQVADGFIRVDMIVVGVDGCFAFGPKYTIHSFNETMHALRVNESKDSWIGSRIASFFHLNSTLRIFSFEGRMYINKILN